MQRLIMKDYGKKNAYLNLQANANHLATYLVNYVLKHSHYDEITSVAHNQKKIQNIKKTLSIMIEGQSWDVNIYQPRHNKLYTGLIPQQYMKIEELHQYVSLFQWTIEDLNRTNKIPYYEYTLSKDQLRTYKIIIYLYHKYQDSVFDLSDAIDNLSKAKLFLHEYLIVRKDYKI